MSKKYISPVQNANFVYPNNDPTEYDIEIIHDINNNSVSGTVTNFSATTISSSAITFTYDFTWVLNGAEPFITDSGLTALLSVHMMIPGQTMYKPFRVVRSHGVTNPGSTYSVSGATFTATPDGFGFNAFTNGDYYFEFRFIGHRAIYPICQTYSISSIIAPTPTPTPTPTITPTHTITPTPSPTPLVYQSGATLNVTDTGYIKYDTYSGTTYVNIGSTGTYTITDCVLCSSIRPGIPFADVAAFTVTNCGTVCGGTPPSTPTPTPTITPSSGLVSYNYYEVDRYECSSPSGPCTYVETINIANESGVLIGGKFYLDNISGYIFNIVSSVSSGAYMITNMSGPGTNNCSSLCGI